MNFRSAACLFVLASLLSAESLPAQGVWDTIQTPHGRCALRVSIPGGSNADRDFAYNRCALDRAPVLLPGEPMPPPPWEDPRGGGTFTVIVNADGTVDPGLTRAWTRMGDTIFHRRTLETLRGWRFEPGMRQGVPVRSGFRLHIDSGTREDTVPSRLEWSYRSGLHLDSLVGTWMTGPPAERLPAERVDSIYAAMLRHLLYQKVLVPDYSRRFCLVLPDGDSVEHARLSRLAERAMNAGQYHYRSRFAPFGCERMPEPLRIFLPRVHPTEGTRAVLYPRGDFLPYWPVSFDGRSYHSWEGRCVADVPATGAVGIDCFVMPGSTRGEFAGWERGYERRRAWAQRRPSREASTVDSISVTVLVKMQGAYQIDTMTAVVHPLPRFTAGDVLDSNPPCGGLSVHSMQESSELLVIHGDPWSRSLSITAARHGAPPEGPPSTPRCGSQETTRDEFVAFLLGDIGDAVREPITICFFGGTQCGRRYVLDPERHALAERALLRFRKSDLREDTRVGDQLEIRIYADPAPEDLIPLVVVHTGEWRWAHIMVRSDLNAWDFNVGYENGFPAEGEVFLYLIGR